ncbi:MAG: RNA polymerase sigma factor [Verrucomicrobiae bacterium]|nr:RNA polymerase sigma factor [Verrucomicrobiae bacterium]
MTSFAEGTTRNDRENAFAALTERHLDHVHSVALRVTCNAALAADVSQQVFAKLAAEHASIPTKVPLSAWLHVKARSLAIDTVRSEEARRRREQRYQETIAMNATDPDERKQWEEMESLVDEGVGALTAKYRDAILLRFYRKLPFSDVGAELAISEDAARMRVQRGLDRLSQWLRRRSVATNAVALASLLGTFAVASAPKALAASISTAAATTTATLVSTSTLTTAIAMTKSHLAAIVILAVGIPVIVLQRSENTELRKQLEIRQRTPLADTRLLPNRPTAAATTALPKVEAGRTPSPTTLRDIFAESDPMRRMAALLDYVNALAPADIPRALEEMRGSSPEWDTETKFLTHMLLTGWAQEDPDAAFASLNKLDFKRLGGEPSSLLSSLASVDPTRAAAWLDDPENALVHYPKMGHVLAGTVAKEWVRQDVDAALAWARALPESRRAGALSGVLGTLAGSDPREASRLATQLDPGEERSHAVGEIASTWARQSPTEAMAWAQSLDGGDAKSAVGRALGSWADVSPREAADWLGSQSEPEFVDANLPTVAGSWSTAEPAEAATWVAALPEGKGKGDALGVVMWNWTNQDPEAASTWLVEQPPGESRDRGITGLAKAAFDADPAGAVTWAAHIDNEELRQQAVNIGLRVWNERDPVGAQAWAGENGIALPSQEKPEK